VGLHNVCSSHDDVNVVRLEWNEISGTCNTGEVAKQKARDHVRNFGFDEGSSLLRNFGNTATLHCVTPQKTMILTVAPVGASVFTECKDPSR
jgi:hypothetical protein